LAKGGVAGLFELETSNQRHSIIKNHTLLGVGGLIYTVHGHIKLASAVPCVPCVEIMRQPALALCVCVSVCVSRAALLPVASLRTRLPQCRARAGVIRAAAPDNVLTDEDALAAQRRVWALIFNYRSENEGIYTQQRGDGREYVLTWQAEEDATRYGDMLSDAQDFPEGSAVEMETQTLLDFCKEAGHTLCLVPSSTVVIPPDANVDEFEWSREELEVQNRSRTDTLLEKKPHTPNQLSLYPPAATLTMAMHSILTTATLTMAHLLWHQEGSLDAQEMTEDNLKRRRKELESMLGMGPGSAEPE
jgi:hypothetical protein